ncbi:hypothetical protein [Exiguobacterium sp. HVEsp1]|uniref:hypothetical protein n=1 Tax=Exiguobacterium sp. HVEsp1 TaxID=1934003 RepID=UPI00099111D1|nr:hypothetical protein [Exiguobacterium sp. HVEsp1]
MNNKFDNIYSLKYESEDIIIDTVCELSKRNIHLYDELHTALAVKSDFQSLQQSDTHGREFLLEAIFLSFIVASISSSMASDNKKEFMKKMRRVAERLGLNINDVIRITHFEQEIIKIIKRQ